MSTKCTIISTLEANIYEETSQPQFIFGKFVGWDINLVIDKPFITKFRIIDINTEIYLTESCKLAKIIGNQIKLHTGDITYLEFDSEDLMITIKGGSQTAELIKTNWAKKQ